MSAPSRSLPVRDLHDLARQISLGRADASDTRAVLEALADRGETADDLLAFAAPFRQASIKVVTKHPVVLDMCGTGGAGFRTFNVSTLASLVVSSLGVPVAKHGNRSSNGMCGSADLLQALGVDIDLGPERAGRILDEIGMTFLYAPIYHPALRHVASVRKSMGRRSIFNLLGPLLNPVEGRKRQLIGVYDPRSLDVVPMVLRELGIDRAMVVHGHPGMDEVSTLGPTDVVEVRSDGIIKYQISPSDLGIETPLATELAEQAPEAAARLALGILRGESSGMSDIVALNAACGLFTFGAVGSIEAGLERAREALHRGMALRQLQRLIDMSHGRSV
jgi:anthranilate phosphoribosyltransferase